jgi:transcriptional regulator with XRE-family HTH domain
LGVGGYLTLRPRLADALRQLRERTRLTTYQLADRLGWSQGKVHKIEARRQGITPDDAEAWAIACGARDRAQELRDLAERSLAETVAFRGALRERLPRQQREAQAIEASAGLIRVYHPTTIPGLLQTMAYAEAVFASNPSAPVEDPAIRLAAAARLERQQILFDSSKRFQLALSEAALRWDFGPRDERLGQLDRLRQVAPLPNVEIRILPASARVWWFQPVRLFEERTDDADALAVVETLVGNVTYSDPTDVDRYRKAFSGIWEAAIAGEEAIAFVNRLAAELQAGPPRRRGRRGGP